MNSVYRVYCRFLVLLMTRPKLPLGQILNHATCNINSPKAVEIQYMDYVLDIVFFIVCKLYFFLILSKC